VLGGPNQAHPDCPQCAAAPEVSRPVVVDAELRGDLPARRSILGARPRGHRIDQLVKGGSDLPSVSGPVFAAGK
jgi:hypothetical protein